MSDEQKLPSVIITAYSAGQPNSTKNYEKLFYTYLYSKSLEMSFQKSEPLKICPNLKFGTHGMKIVPFDSF